MDPETITLQLAAMLLLGIGTIWAAALIRLPSILLLLIVGIIAGPMMGWIEPTKTLGNLLMPIISLSVAIILFEGGLSLRFKEIRKVGHLVRNLVTIGVLSALLTTNLFLTYVLQFSPSFSLLLSATLVITGPTVVTPMLLYLHIKQPVRSILHWEGIATDPVGAIAAVVIFEGLLHTGAGGFWQTVVIGALTASVVGALLGGVSAALFLLLLYKFWIPDSLHSPVTLLFVILIFILSNMLQADSGLLSVTILGIILANQQKVKVHHIIDFKEKLRMILLAFLFILLSASIDLERTIASVHISLALLFFLIVIARPLSVFFSGAFKHLPLKQALFLCCLAPRGIVCATIASLFGLRLAETGFSGADYMVPITFAVIIGTIAFYSLFTPFAAHFLNVRLEQEAGILIIGANKLARAIGAELMANEYKVQLIDPNFSHALIAKQSVLPVYPGTFLQFEKEAPEAFEEMNLMLAMTENDDINSLAVIHMRTYFNEEQLYQLPVTTKKIEESLMGQQLFEGKYDYEYLTGLQDKYYKVKSTNLTEEFTYEDWQKTYAERNAVLLFIIMPSGKLIPERKGHPPAPRAGSKIIFMAST